VTPTLSRQTMSIPKWMLTVRNLIGAGNLIGAAGFAEKVGDRVKNHR
jgi:hypothetical protein